MVALFTGSRFPSSITIDPPPSPAAPFCGLGFPCPPCPSLCVRGVGFRVLAHRAQLGRVGGSRLGLGSSNKIPCHHSLSLSLLLDDDVYLLLMMFIRPCASSVYYDGRSTFCDANTIKNRLFKEYWTFQVQYTILKLSLKQNEVFFWTSDRYTSCITLLHLTLALLALLVKLLLSLLMSNASQKVLRPA